MDASKPGDSRVRTPSAYGATLAGSSPGQSAPMPPAAGDVARDEQLVGQTILGDRYRVIRVIGRGGMSVVYEVADLVLRRRVALKILDLAQVPVDMLRQRSLVEAQSQGQNTHPNIVAVYDVGTVPGEPFAGRPFIVMELVEGMNLDQFIGSPEILTLSIENAVSIMEQILSALEVAHAAGSIHRDLKPDNVFLEIGERRGRPVYRAKVGDFGLAKQGDRSSGTMGVIGTPPYMSPEQAGNSSLDARSDLYSAGLIAYELLTGGHYAYESYRSTITDSKTGQENLALVMATHITKPIDNPRAYRPELPQALIEFLYTALAKSPDQRFQSAGEMLDALQAASGVRQSQYPSLPGSGELAPTIPLTRVKQRTSRGRTVFGIGGIVFGIVAVVALAFQHKRSASDQTPLPAPLTPRVTASPIVAAPLSQASPIAPAAISVPVVDPLNADRVKCVTGMQRGRGRILAVELAACQKVVRTLSAQPAYDWAHNPVDRLIRQLVARQGSVRRRVRAAPTSTPTATSDPSATSPEEDEEEEPTPQ